MAAHLANVQKGFPFAFHLQNVLIIFICNEISEQMANTRNKQRLGPLKFSPIFLGTFQGLFPHALPSS